MFGSEACANDAASTPSAATASTAPPPASAAAETLDAPSPATDAAAAAAAAVVVAENLDAAPASANLDADLSSAAHREDVVEGFPSLAICITHADSHCGPGFENWKVLAWWS